MPNYYSYKLVWDYGFAPNPFHGFCTLATCKPHIRKSAQVGDWIIGTGAVTTNLKNRLIYTMKISEKITFSEYWLDKRFQLKKPLLKGSLIRIHGDNIYYKDSDEDWHQMESQHSNYNRENLVHKKNDLSGKYVLISDYFFYFGDNHFQIPTDFLAVCSSVRDFFKIKNPLVADNFIDYIVSNYSPGIIGDPIDWKEYRQRSIF